MVGRASDAAVVERDGELEAMRSAARAAVDGRGSLLAIGGAAGLGKTTLLAAAALDAERGGMQVLRAAAAPLDAAVPYAALGALLTGLGPAQDLAGAARLLRPVFDPGAEVASAEAVGFGLTRLLEEAAERAPLWLALDDSHWADGGSLAALAEATRLLFELPVVLAVAVRSGESPADPEALDALLEHPEARRLRLAPLSEEGVARVCRTRLGDGAAPEAVRAAYRLTGGNPLFLTELLEEAAADGRLDAGALRDAAPAAIGPYLRTRLAGVERPARRLADALAVLERAPLEQAVSVAGLEADEGAAARRALAEARLLAAEEPLRFAHPVVREAVRGTLSEHTARHLHARAAAVLRAAGAGPERVGAHLLLAESVEEGWGAEALREAGAAAARRGAPENAARFLGRAVELSPEGERDQLRLELGRAQLAAGRAADAESTFAAVAERSSALAARALLGLGRARMAAGRMAAACEALDAGLAADAEDRELRGELRAALEGAARLDPGRQPALAEELQAVLAQPRERDVAGDRALLAAGALNGALTLSLPRERTLAMARRAWAEGRMAAECSDAAMIPSYVTGVLLAAEELEEDEAVAAELLAEGRRRGSLSLIGAASYLRGCALIEQGRVLEGLADAELGADPDRHGWSMFYPSAVGLLAVAQLERGEPERALRTLDPVAAPDYEASLSGIVALSVRGRVLIALGRPREALADLEPAGEALRSLAGIRNTNSFLFNWQTWAVVAAALGGDRERAARHSETELELARAWGAPGAIGRALWASSFTLSEEAAERRLAESVKSLEHSRQRLDLVRALCDLGAARRRLRASREARVPLRRALELAEAGGARALAERARDELEATGERRLRRDDEGRTRLTPAERRAATMAARGMTNREIAYTVGVTVKTVEKQLAEAYGKLGIGSRRELRGALGDA
jgi:DNA-binding CsgD family transcriptional regulator